MGLRERRLLHTVQTEALPQTEIDLNSLVGGRIEWRIDWDSFGVDELSAGNLQHQGLGRIYSAIRAVSRDELGQNAVREKIKAIQISNTKAHPRSVTLEDGILKITGWYGSDETGSYFTDSELERSLEDLL